MWVAAPVFVGLVSTHVDQSSDARVDASFLCGIPRSASYNWPSARVLPGVCLALVRCMCACPDIELMTWFWQRLPPWINAHISQIICKITNQSKWFQIKCVVQLWAELRKCCAISTRVQLKRILSRMCNCANCFSFCLPSLRPARVALPHASISWAICGRPFPCQ